MRSIYPEGVQVILQTDETFSRFAEGEQGSSDVLDLLKGIPEIEYNTPDDVAREIDHLESERIRPSKPKEE